MNIDEFLSEYKHIWKTKAALMAWLRGGIRRSLWNNSPVKLEFVKKNRIRIPNPNPKGKTDTVWGAKCSLTGEVHPLSRMQVDHREGNHSLNDLDDLQSFIENIVLVSEDDLAFVEKEAHKVKSYADKQGISFESALAEKAAIALVKEKKDLQWLIERGIVPLSSQQKRRQQIVEHILKEKEK